MLEFRALQRLHLWLESGEGMLLCYGRIMLLERIERLGSLNKAAAAMGMSYRAAWGRLKQSETALGEPLVERAQARKGYRLTPFGVELVRVFTLWREEVEAYALTRANEIFPWPTLRYKKPRPEADGKEAGREPADQDNADDPAC